MKYQFSIYRTISTFFILFFFSYAIAESDDGSIFIHAPSFLLVCGLGFFIVLAVYEMEFLRFIIHALRLLAYKPLEPNPQFAQIALFASRTIIGTGIITMIIGLIQMLQNLNSPDHIGLSMAVAMLSPLYAVIVSEVFCAIAYQSFKESNDPSNKNKVLPAINAALPLLTILFTISTFLLLILSFVDLDTYQHGF